MEKKRKKKKMMKKKGDGGAGAATRSALAKVVLRGETDYERWTNNERGILVSVRRDAGADLDLIGEASARGGDFEKKMKNKTTNEENGEGDKMETNGEDEKEQHKLKSDESSAAAMAFLVRLSFQHPGRKYSKANLSEAERRVASHLSALGVLYENEDDENDNNWYVPTVLSAGLSSVSTTSSAKSALARIDGTHHRGDEFQSVRVHPL